MSGPHDVMLLFIMVISSIGTGASVMWLIVLYSPMMKDAQRFQFLERIAKRKDGWGLMMSGDGDLSGYVDYRIAQERSLKK